MKEINLTMKPVCECGYVFDNLVLKRIRPKFIPNALASQFYAYEFDPPECSKCGNKIGSVTAPLINEADGLTIFAKKEENNAE